MTLEPPELLRPEARKRSAEISTKILSDDLTEVTVPGHVVGYIKAENDVFIALRGDHVHSAEEVGRYATHGLALEAVRLRKRSI